MNAHTESNIKWRERDEGLPGARGASDNQLFVARHTLSVKTLQRACAACMSEKKEKINLDMGAMSRKARRICTPAPAECGDAGIQGREQ